MAWSVSAESERYDDAVDFLRSRIPCTRGQYDRLDDTPRARAFWISGALEADVVQTIHEEIGNALETGEGLAAWKKRVKEKLAGRVGPSGHHLETVFRNASQTAYNTARWYEMTDPELVLLRPYLIYDSVLDGRTTHICKTLDGTSPSQRPKRFALCAENGCFIYSRGGSRRREAFVVPILR